MFRAAFTVFGDYLVCNATMMSSIGTLSSEKNALQLIGPFFLLGGFLRCG